MLSSLPVFWSEQVRTFLLIGWWDGIILTTKLLLYTIYTGHCGVGQLNPTKCEIVLLGQAGTRGCQGVKCFSLKPGKFNYLNRTFELRTLILDIFILLTRCDGRRRGMHRAWYVRPADGSRVWRDAWLPSVACRASAFIARIALQQDHWAV